MLGPQMSAGLRLDQLRGDADAITAPPDRALEDIAYAELSTDLLYIDRLALVREARIARDHEQPADAAERGDDLLDHAVGEVFLLRVAAHVLERQDRDRRLVGQRQRRFARSRYLVARPFLFDIGDEAD